MRDLSSLSEPPQIRSYCIKNYRSTFEGEEFLISSVPCHVAQRIQKQGKQPRSNIRRDSCTHHTEHTVPLAQLANFVDRERLGYLFGL